MSETQIKDILSRVFNLKIKKVLGKQIFFLGKFTAESVSYLRVIYLDVKPTCFAYMLCKLKSTDRGREGGHSVYRGLSSRVVLFWQFKNYFGFELNGIKRNEKVLVSFKTFRPQCDLIRNVQVKLKRVINRIFTTFIK